MAKDTGQCEGPAEQGKSLFTPDGAEKLPIKHYPGSRKLSKGGGGGMLEGPNKGLFNK